MKTKIIKLEGNSEISFLIRFVPTSNGEDPQEYYNIEIIHDTEAVGGKLESLRTVKLVPKTSIVEEFTEFLEDL